MSSQAGRERSAGAQLSAAEENFKSCIDGVRYKFLLRLEKLCKREHFNLTENSPLVILNGHNIKKKAIANIVKNILDDLSYCHHCISVW